LEFDIPAGFRMFDVDGPKLGGWWRVGNRVAVWFDSGAPASVEVTFRGAMNSDLVAASAEGGIDLPLPRWLNLRMAGHPMQLEVRNGVGYQAKLVNAIGMQVNDELPPAPGRWNFLAVPGSNAVPSVKFFILRMDDKPNRFDDTEPSSKPIATKEVNKTPLVPPTAEPPAEPRQRPFAHLIPWIGAGAWLIGLMLVARWPVRRWPERLAFLGLLGAAALGFLSLSGMAMLALAAFGVAARVRKFLT